MAYWAAGMKLTGARMNAAPGRYPVGGDQRGTGTVSTSGTTELAVCTTDVLALDASSLYVITFATQAATNSSTAERWIQRIRKTNVTGTQLAVDHLSPANEAGEPIGEVLTWLYPTTATENTAFCGTFVRDTSNSAGNTATFGGSPASGTYILVEKLLFLNGVMETT
jgi:hypothetical protein